MIANPFCCPVCQEPLQQKEKNLRCVNNHSFDQARQGYWNLLLAHKKRSKDPGDNAEMVAARQHFLSQGHYQPLSDAINQIACSHLASLSETAQIVDMGCGEGYYTDRMQQALSDKEIENQIIALDISKHAVKTACKQNKSITWLVASGAAIPVEKHSQHLITVLFSRLMPESLSKATCEEGLLLLVWPAEQHLIELRQMIYQQIKPSTYNPVELLAEHYVSQQQQRLTFSFTLESEQDIQSLLDMTPHSQRLTDEKLQQLKQQDQLSLTFDCHIGVFKRL